MANRPVYYIENDRVKEKMVDFEWYPGFSVRQKQKSIRNLHENFENNFHWANMLEISSKSENNLGVKLSAFNLTIETKNKIFSVESAFQSSKNFENGGPFIDLLYKTSKEAKQDSRLKNSGNLIKFSYNKIDWELEPKTFFYDWLYINTLYRKKELSEKILKYNAFTDIEFNPKKSINCQARSATLFVLLKKLNLLDEAMESIEKYKEIIKPFYINKNNKIKVGNVFKNDENQLSFTPSLIDKNKKFDIKESKTSSKEKLKIEKRSNNESIEKVEDIVYVSKNAKKYHLKNC